jgi:hypothetical protein
MLLLSLCERFRLVLRAGDGLLVGGVESRAVTKARAGVTETRSGVTRLEIACVVASVELIILASVFTGARSQCSTSKTCSGTASESSTSVRVLLLI